jgi:hypothetical protein
MSEFVAIDDDGATQIGWLQEHGDTCGPACVFTVERIIRQATTMGGEERITFLTSMLPNGYTEGSGTQSYTALRQVLSRIGIPSGAVRVTNFGNFVNEGYFPFIARIAWNSGGGHFVVCVKVTGSGKLVCLDPWYGFAQPNLSNLPGYTIESDARAQMSLLNVIGATFSGHVVFPNADSA